MVADTETKPLRGSPKPPEDGAAVFQNKKTKKAIVDSEDEGDSEDEDEDQGRQKGRNEKGVSGLPFVNVPSVKFAIPEPFGDKRKREEKEGKAYTKQSPIDKSTRVNDVAEQIMKTQIQLEQADLIGLSPALAKELGRLMAKKRIPTEPVGSTDNLEKGFKKRVDRDSVKHTNLGIALKDLPQAQFSFLKEDDGVLKKGCVVMNDPYLQYLDSLKPDEEPQPVYVAAESQSIRAVHPLVNSRDHMECILDGGSQVVSMSFEVAEKLGLHWNPDIVIHMQSANQQIQPTLGLAKNVPFHFGEITVYLQVHIVQKAAYKILLGRPFDVLTESEIKNLKDGGQYLVLKDPNTGTRVRVGTVDRGAAPSIISKPDFR